MPFELIQKTYLKEDLQRLKKRESRLLEIVSEYEEILDSLTEEEKESEVVKESKDAFVNKEITKEVKQIKADIKKGSLFEEDSFENKILKVGELITEKKEFKKIIKSEEIELHSLTKENIENLSETQVYELLELKWISPLVTSLKKSPDAIISELTAKAQALSEKYDTTYSNIVEQIHETESSLSTLINELVGNEYDTKGLSEFKSLLMGE